MKVSLSVNGGAHALEVAPGERLLVTLRGLGYFGVKHGCETGECGQCTVLLEGRPISSCVLFAAQAQGRAITTIEGLGRRPQLGWRQTPGLHPLQLAFAETGAIQCGYCTPGMVLAARALLDRDPNPSRAEIEDALSGVLCRCTGYVKPVQAVLRAAALLRGEPPPPLGWQPGAAPPGEPSEPAETPPSAPPLAGLTLEAPSGVAVLPRMWVTPATQRSRVVGKPEMKVDALKLVQGKPAFTDDIELRGMLQAKVLWSPLAHAGIKRIDASRARALPGVHAVLTHHDLPRVAYSTAGQSDPIPGPLDMFSLDAKVRFVGDRVAFVAAETEEIAERALELIAVEYEPLPAVLDPEQAMVPGAPVIHDEPEYVPFHGSEPERNLAARIRIETGEMEPAWAEADHVFEETYRVPRVQQASLEPHVVVTWWDEDDRLVIRTSTQVPFHVRRQLAPVLGLPVGRIRVIKPRIGGGFGGKQEVMIEDVAAHLTIATGRPVRFEYTRAEEFFAARSRHPMRVRLRTGVRRDGTIVANEMHVLSDTGAYGCHALTVAGNTGHKAMALYPGLWREHRQGYRYAALRFHADIVYTNTPPAGAFRGYGCPQGFFPLEVHMETIARALGLDPLEFRLSNALKEGDEHPLSRSWSEGKETRPEVIQTCALPECARRGAEVIGFQGKRADPLWHEVPGKPHLRRGIGLALVMQGTAIPYLDMGGASLKMNDDGSFNLLAGATDIGTGADTVLAQMAAEVLGVGLEDIIVHSSDTDFTPFDKGAYASSTTYISGYAVVRAAQQCAEQIRLVAARMLSREGAPVEPHEVDLHDRRCWAPDGRSVGHQEVALNSLHHEQQHQIMAVGSYMSPVAPPPFAAQFAEVTVDRETGALTVDRLTMALDCGRIVNPATASGQVEGGMIQALGYAVCEEMTYDREGRPEQLDFSDYHIFRADEVPPMDVIFVETDEPSHPFGVKAVAEIPMDGVAPAVANAVRDAVGVTVTEIPATPERVWQLLRAAEGTPS